MSKRPAAIYNDPGYFYNQRKLLKIFFFGCVALVAGILAMIWVDWDRPWKDQQREQRTWEASRMALEDWILKVETQDLRRSLAKGRRKARKERDTRSEELARVRERIAEAEAIFASEDIAYKAQKQFTTQADFRVHAARSDGDLEAWRRRLDFESDKELRLRNSNRKASASLARLKKEEERLQRELDAVLTRERENPKLKRMRLLDDNIAKKRSYSPLREIPLLDFLAPPTHVEQVVLDNLVDDYEFSTPRKVDRCGTCHIGVMRRGFEAERWPVEILDPEFDGEERVKRFEEAVYRFVFTMVDGYTESVPGDAKFERELEQLREVKIHHAALSLMYAEYDEESGEIGLDKQGRKIWRRWYRTKKKGKKGKKGRWKSSATKGVGIHEFFLGVLQGMRGNWQTHPHFDDMVGDSSPHPYEDFGCTTCHLGRGWSTDFGFAYHTPDRLRIEDWMTTAWAEENGKKIPLSAGQTLEEAMARGNPEGNPAHVGFVADEETGRRWEEELGWTHEKRHYWLWPQHPKSLVQASCLKCHKEGLYATPEEEYASTRVGKPDPDEPSLLEYELHSGEFNETAPGRLFLSRKEKAYRPGNLERGMDNFLRFGCYACHKLDPEKYAFMKSVRPKVGPQLNDIATKTTREFLQKWIRNPKDFRPGTRMPVFWNLANNSHDFRYRFAAEGMQPVDGRQWGEMEVYAITEWILSESDENSTFTVPRIDLVLGDAARGERILVGDYDASGALAKACVACHEVPIETEELRYDKAAVRASFERGTGVETGWKARMSRRQGPDLAGIGSKVKAGWLYAWLKDPKGYWHETNMPDLRLTDQEALDVTAYLMKSRHEEFDRIPGVGVDMPTIARMAQELKVGEQRETTRQALGIVGSWTDRDKVLYVGRKLVKHYGCFGCHRIDEYETATPIGTELTQWGSKNLARLEFNHAPFEHERFDFAYTKMMNPRVYDLGMPRRNRPYERLRMPRFGFTPEESRDFATFLLGLVSDPVPAASLFRPDERQEDIIRGRQIVRQYNCQGCHPIEGQGGDIRPTITQEKWKPPDLLGQGRKTNPDWLFHFMKDPEFIALPGVEGSDRIRPWHSIRMPTFGLRDEEARAVVRYFAALSRTTNDFETSEKDSLLRPSEGYPKSLTVQDPEDKTREIRTTVGNRLEEAGAMFLQYQCKSCHSSDQSVPIGNRAPSFRLTRNGRLREAWIGHWLWNPSKLQTGTSMPAFFINEVEGKLVPKAQDPQFFGGDAGEQIRAVRDYIRNHYKDD